MIERRKLTRRKSNHNHTRCILEVLEHKIAPHVRKVKELVQEHNLNIFCEDDAIKIRKEIEKLEKTVTVFILKELHKSRRTD